VDNTRVCIGDHGLPGRIHLLAQRAGRHTAIQPQHMTPFISPLLSTFYCGSCVWLLTIIFMSTPLSWCRLGSPIYVLITNHVHHSLNVDIPCKQS